MDYLLNGIDSASGGLTSPLTIPFTSLAIVFICGLITALATGLGPLAMLIPALRRPTSQGWSLYGAAGVMLVMSLLLIIESSTSAVIFLHRLCVSSVLFLAVSQLPSSVAGVTAMNSVWHYKKSKKLKKTASLIKRRVDQNDHDVDDHPYFNGTFSSRGLAVGVAPLGGWDVGIAVTIGMAIHNIPEGLAIALVAMPAGMSLRRAVLWSIFSSLPQPLLAVPAFWAVSFYQPLIPLALGAAAAMIWLCLGELIPEGRKILHQQRSHSPNRQRSTGSVSV